VPAAAVIPAPIAYIKIVAVKKLVVGFLALARLVRRGFACEYRCVPVILRESCSILHWIGTVISIFYFEKIRVFKAGLRYEYISME
jgi:hypothetical protein